MGNILGGLKPQLVWNHFEELCNHPRPSKKEEKAVGYIISVAKKNNLQYRKDSFGNIVIYKPAAKGKENLKTVVLQGHIDMVCEKNRDVEHDFDNEPIHPYIDGEWVKAKGTTLGADNGIGVAAALAILEDKDAVHGPIECLFTLDEETGLTGASSLGTDLLKGTVLINLDSEELGTFFIGCSGGKNTAAVFNLTLVDAPKDSDSFEIKVLGLKGGHSGLEINSGLGNAIKIINRLLWNAKKKFDIKIASIEGGNKHNAIPRETFAKVIVSKNNSSAFKKYVEDYNKIVQEENATVDPNLNVTASPTDAITKVIEDKQTDKILCSLYAVPHGVLKMSADIPGLVETSTNLATISVNDDKLKVLTSQRSSFASEIIDASDMVAATFSLAGAEVSQGDGYPGWKPNVKSEILNLFKSTFNKLYNSVPEVKAIHAGLECGIINEKYPNMDMISFGPTMHGVHSPDEKLKIDTVEPFYNLLKEVLRNIPSN